MKFANHKKTKTDIYASVTNRIIADLEKGVATWHKPWADGAPIKTRPLRHNGQSYSGVNVLLLWGEAVENGFTSPYWMTYQQAKKLNGQVRKGEHGTMIVFSSTFTKKETLDDGEEVEKTYSFLKTYSVFNTQQIDGLPERYAIKAPENGNDHERIHNAENFVYATHATINHRGNRAYYSPGVDTITLPEFQTFTDREAYYGVALHELTHWTGAKTRLDRTFGKAHADTEYAREELVAELSAAYLCADLGIESEPRADHASYMVQWLKVLKADKRAIFQASAHAQRAADFLQALQPKAATANAPANEEVAA